MTLSWRAGGLLLGVVFFAAVLLVKPIGVSTQFVIFDGLLWNAIDDTVVVASSEAKSGFTSPNAYLAKSGGKYAKAIANPAQLQLCLRPGDAARRIWLCAAAWRQRAGRERTCRQCGAPTSATR